MQVSPEISYRSQLKSNNKRLLYYLCYSTFKNYEIFIKHDHLFPYSIIMRLIIMKELFVTSLLILKSLNVFVIINTFIIHERSSSFILGNIQPICYIIINEINNILTVQYVSSRLRCYNRKCIQMNYISRI